MKNLLLRETKIKNIDDLVAALKYLFVAKNQIVKEAKTQEERAVANFAPYCYISAELRNAFLLEHKIVKIDDGPELVINFISLGNDVYKAEIDISHWFDASLYLARRWGDG